MRKQKSKTRRNRRSDSVNSLKKAKSELPRLLYDREETSRMTGLTVATLIRWKGSGG